MRMRFRMVVLAACGLGACSSGGGTGAADGSEEAAVLADSAAGDSYQEVTLGADSAALALVEEYLRRDAQGEFTRASQWLDEYVIGFTGSDFVTIVSEYKVLAAETSGDTTRVKIEYDVIGGLDTGYDGEPVWTLTDSVELHTFVVLRMKEGMRLDDPLPAIHVSGRVVLEQGIPADEDYRRALADAIRRKGGTPPNDP